MIFIGKIPFSSFETPLIMSFLILTVFIIFSYFILTLLGNVKKLKRFPLEKFAYYLLFIWGCCLILFFLFGISILIMSSYHIGFLRAFIGTVLTSAFIMVLFILHPSILLHLAKKYPKKKNFFKFLFNSIIVAFSFLAIFILITMIF
ncbi:MAG: hypothetical protein KR126chlam4_01553 [Candidatus Anoxychlamydiales bacterium]|nr:hypothetical protein [Candidatus Anoxychlamydiales bacterium]NGX41707.1 hypothetical protein [Candidatus Anoxychlamydiales bacterium]